MPAKAQCKGHRHDTANHDDAEDGGQDFAPDLRHTDRFRLQPLPAEWQRRFLTNLAWFQWAPAEAASCWAFLREALA